MNANELADELDDFSEMGGDVFFGVCANMLRQQQAENDKLKIKKETLNLNLNNLIKEWTALQAENEKLKAEIVAIEKNTDYWADKANWIKNNKPLAWMLKTGHGTKILEVKPYCEVDYWIPLYTNPVKEQDMKYDVTIKWDDKTTHHEEVLGDTPLHHTNPVKKELTDEEIHQAIRRGFARDGFLSDGIFLEIKEVLRKAQEQ